MPDFPGYFLGGFLPPFLVPQAIACSFGLGLNVKKNIITYTKFTPSNAAKSILYVMEEKLVEAVVGLILALTIYLKNRSEVNGVKADRERTKIERDTRIALLEQKVAEHDRMMAEGNDRFDRIERELKETNGLLRELVGMFKVSRMHSHTEDAC